MALEIQSVRTGPLCFSRGLVLRRLMDEHGTPKVIEHGTHLFVRIGVYEYEQQSEEANLNWGEDIETQPFSLLEGIEPCIIVIH